jgi:hypothetical protein
MTNGSVKKEYIFQLLNTICHLKTEKYYLVNNDAFKKMKMLGLYEELTNNLKPFYKPSKQYYLTREAKYTSFTTLLRHMCKANNIMFSSKIKYDKSNYEIIYYVYKTD